MLKNLKLFSIAIPKYVLGLNGGGARSGGEVVMVVKGYWWWRSGGGSDSLCKGGSCNSCR